MDGYVVRLKMGLGYRFFLIATADKAQAEAAVMAIADPGETVESVPLADKGLLTYMYMKPGDVREWVPHDEATYSTPRP